MSEKQGSSNSLSTSKRWFIALQAVGILSTLAVVIGVAAVYGSAARHPAHRPQQATAGHSPHATFSLPVTVNLTAVLAVIACLLALSGWAMWQRSNRCGDCGYTPMFCHC